MKDQLFENEYEQSKDYANKIISTADETQEIFNSMNDIMNLVAQHWQSSGANEVIAMYNDIKAKYPAICEKIKAYATTIIKDVDNYQATDSSVSKMVDNA